MKRLFLYITCLCFSIGTAQNSVKELNSIENELYFYLLDVELGLSNNEINTITQDSLGFIWVGTSDGLNRYDGTEFTVFKREDVDGNKNLSDDFINEIKAFNGHKLLVATPEGINIYNAKTEKFEIINEEKGLLGKNISHMELSASGDIYLGVVEKGIQVFDKNRQTKVYTHKPDDEASLSSNYINSLEYQADSLLWVGTSEHGLNKINVKTDKVTRVPLRGQGNRESFVIEALYNDRQGNLWIGTKHNGLHVITKAQDTLHLGTSMKEGKGLSDDEVLCFEEDNSGQLWIGTRNGGLNIINKSDFIHQKTNFQVKWFLPANDGSSVFNRSVLSLRMDKDKNMWIGTSTGLNYVNPAGEPIKLIRKKVTNKGISHDRIGALAESYDRRIWIGTDGGGLDLFNPETKSFEYFKNDPKNTNSISNNYIIALLEDSQKRLWIGTYQGGLNKMDIETGVCKHYLQGNISQGSDVRVVFEDAEKQIWVGTNRGGLYRYNEEGDTFDYISEIGKLDIRDIKEDSYGHLWMATFGDGILEYKPKTNSVTFYNSRTIEGFKTDVIFSILTLPNGDVLAGTQNEGLIRLNPKTNDITVFIEKNGLSNNTITSMVMENQENIWLGTHKGISNYNALTDVIHNLNTYTNIQQGKFNVGSSLMTSSGMVYLGGDKGLNIFNPDNLHTKRETYPIVFKLLEVLDEKVKVSDNEKEAVLDESIFFEDHIYLQPNHTFFSIEYVALKFPFAKNVDYSFRVDGFHDRWVNTSQYGKVNLVNLPFGDYNLNVKAKFGSGDQSVKKIKITVLPPFWKTSWAYIGYLVLLVAGIYWFMKYYTERIKLINSLVIEKKERQLEYNFNEERMRFFTSFSHELKTPLTLILAPLEDLIAEVKSIKHKNSLTLVQKNAKQLLQTINKLLEFRKANLGLSKLRIEEHNLNQCLEQWIVNYFPLAKKRNISLSYDLPDENFTAWFDLEKMHVIFNNLLSNAFKYTPDGGDIYVSLVYDDESFEINVRDTGYGISKEELEYVFERYYQSNSVKSKQGLGIGLALSKSFAELHMGTIQIESEVNKGSTFTMVIPRDKSLFVNAVLDTSNTTDKEESIEVEEWVPVSELEKNAKTSANLNVSESKELVLLIDDNPDILKYLDGLLEGKYDLIYANNGEEGVEKAKRYIPDLIVSDVMMPKLNGIELCNALKDTTETTHIPIILLTAKGNTESIQEGFKYGADDYIVKPFSGQVLQARIRNLLDTRKQLRDYFLNKEGVKLEGVEDKNSLLDQEKGFLNKLTQVILENLDQEKMDVWDVAQNMGMSRTSLFRKLKAITGLNINQFIRKVKLDKAAELIKTGKYTIAQASYEVGFNNVKYFRKLFKEQFEKLPSEFSKN
ncbi:two-component regulator propeller domain-containing protein [Aestuariibaculum sp. YM273]|uniref:hybrid sensor histidine kinase/response regulator n=1 Tax=Aestuariibaculum sp. YM273 TaxID=3070659 RepID=UPI0027DAFC4A|nr:two-component regulator propeller domain-containing protein [Aestuariibaculum sp. YM273]WMI65710.1 two-component regulator propeller domain-containing protein [Aestuariibaculum sp. YM273]